MAHLYSVVRDLIVSIPISISCRLKWCLSKDAVAGAPLATLFAQVALFTASLCLQKTRLCSEYDHSGIKTAILYHICSVLLYYTNRWSGLGFFRRRGGVKVNSIANAVSLILGILLENFYEKSLASLCFALTMIILFLILLVIIRPRTDLGFFGFLLGATGSVAYNLFQLKLGTWIVVAICSLLWPFNCWLDKNWLEPDVVRRGDAPFYGDLERHLTNGNPYPAPVIRSIDALIVTGFYLVWASAFLSTNCLNSESCASCSAMERLKCGAIYGLWLSPAHIHRVYYLFQVEFWVLWPKWMSYAKAIAEMECIRINIKIQKEAGHPRSMTALRGLPMSITQRRLDHHFGIRGLCPPKAMEKLPKWVRNRIENQISKTKRDAEQFDRWTLDYSLWSV